MGTEISIGLGLETWFFICLWLWQRAKDAMWWAAPLVATCLFLSGATVIMGLLVEGAAVLTPLWLGVGALAICHLVAAKRPAPRDTTQVSLPAPDDSGPEQVSPYLAPSQSASPKGDVLHRTRRSIGSFDKDWLWLTASWPCSTALAVKALAVGIPTGMLILLIPLALWIRLVLKAWSTRYIIYQNGIEFVTGLISERRTMLWLWQIKEVTFHCSCLDRVTGGATVIILAEIATSEHGPASVAQFEVAGMPSPKPHWGTTKNMKAFYTELLDAALIKRRIMKNWFV